MSKTAVILTIIGGLLKFAIEFFTPGKRREAYNLKRDKETREALETAEETFHLMEEIFDFLKSENIPDGFERKREWRNFLRKFGKKKKRFFVLD